MNQKTLNMFKQEEKEFSFIDIKSNLFVRPNA